MAAPRRGVEPPPMIRAATLTTGRPISDLTCFNDGKGRVGVLPQRQKTLALSASHLIVTHEGFCLRESQVGAAQPPRKVIAVYTESQPGSKTSVPADYREEKKQWKA